MRSRIANHDSVGGQCPEETNLDKLIQLALLLLLLGFKVVKGAGFGGQNSLQLS